MKDIQLDPPIQVLGVLSEMCPEGSQDPGEFWPDSLGRPFVRWDVSAVCLLQCWEKSGVWYGQSCLGVWLTALLGGNTINGGLVRLSANLILIGRRGGSLRLGPEDFLSIGVKVLRLVGNSGRMWRLGAKGRRIDLVH